MSETVQAWMDATFSEHNPPWEHFAKAIVERWIPVDHDQRLELAFQRMKQRDTLLHYVEQWQILDSALTFSKVYIADSRKVLGFAQGMREQDERFKVIQEKPQTLAEVYAIVQAIRQSKVLALATNSRRDKSPRARRKKRESGSKRRLYKVETVEEAERALKKLEGATKKKAWDTWTCLNCGQMGHLIAGCPSLKFNIKAAVKKYAKLYAKNPKKYEKHTKPSSDQATAGSKRFHKMEAPTNEQKEEEEETESSESVEFDSEASQSHTEDDSGLENSSPESEE